MNDQHFFDLAMKAAARQATDAERAELNAQLAAHPELKAEWERLEHECRLAKELIPLSDAVESEAGELPGYARERLQTKVRERFGRPAPAESKPGWSWRWVMVLAPATAIVVVLAVLALFPPSKPVVQVAVLDTTGVMRGSSTNELHLLRQQWQGAEFLDFDELSLLESWEKSWPAGQGMAVKVVYDPAAAEVRVLVRKRNDLFQKDFPVDSDVAATLRQVAEFIEAHVSQ